MTMTSAAGEVAFVLPGVVLPKSPARTGTLRSVRSMRPRGPSQAASAEGGKKGIMASAAGLMVGLKAVFRRQRKQRRQRQSARVAFKAAQSEIYKEIVNLKDLGSSSFDKALQVNLDPTIYGSFAEIGAGQEVSRTFLTAGAAAGTVARSLSAYDMQLSDVTYGKASRYVTQERLSQMLNTEYDTLEASIRETRGADTRFFAFATTLAAKAYMSDRECEGWVGMTYQHEAGAARSTVRIHVRMSDDTAQKQGQAIGIMGTNLVYLCNFAKDPSVIVSFVLDGIEDGRLEVDYVDFDGPAFPKENMDYRFLAMKMVQFRVAQSVLLEYDEKTEKYRHSVPNSAFYKRPVVVQRSRFRPVTYAHREILEASMKKLINELGPDTKPVMEILDFQIDDIVRPSNLVRGDGRKARAKLLAEADHDGDGSLTVDELKALLSGRLKEAEAVELAKELDWQGAGKIEIDQIIGMSKESAVAIEYTDRFRMLESLKLPVLVSGVSSDAELSAYLARYTNMPVALTVGGGDYNIGRGLFNAKLYERYNGGMLEAFGRLFAGNVRIFQYPNISPNGEVTVESKIDGAAAHLHKYLVNDGKIAIIDKEYMNSSAMNQESNEPFRGQSEDVAQMIRDGETGWEKYVPDEVAEIINKRSWFSRYSKGGRSMAEVAFQVLNNLQA
eukprot:gb/GFBE01074394.1/.p1 GENE.gb/GFBE01074394.1/~~gb/GFBE01074394.1/.p1  ORF type:complete len:670 (+),score=185.74 gb/GFBE01074394.1/:1-2010(+)